MLKLIHSFCPCLFVRRSLSGSVGSSSVGSGLSEPGHRTPVKRVSFSATHSIINGNSGEQTIKHRDSIISASTDSSEDSNSSGETRLGSSFRGKMRPKLPVTTETTRQLADMCNVSMDETAEGIYAETHHRGSQSSFTRSERRRSSIQERRGSCGSSGSENSHRSSHIKGSPLSPHLKQHSLDSRAEGSAVHKKQTSSSPDDHYQHVRRKSEPLVVPNVAKGKEEPADSTYSTVYSSLREEKIVHREDERTYARADDQDRSEPLYNQIRSPASCQPVQATSDRLSSAAIPPPPQFRETASSSDHVPSSIIPHRELSPHKATGHVQSMHVPPPPPPVSAASQVSPAQTADNQQKLHTLRESPYSSAAAALAQSNHSKSSPPPTFPKPSSNFASNISSTVSQPIGLPKQAPPPPLRLSSNESTCSSRTGVDSAPGSPLHVPIPPPMPTLVPKLPPPTLPKSSHATVAAAAAAGITGSSIRSSSPSSRPPSDDGQPKKQVSHLDSSQIRHSRQHKSISDDEMAGCPTQSPSLPFLSELSKRAQLGTGADDSSVEMRNGQPLAVSQQHRRSASAGGVIGKSDKRAPPPPPPKRNESTRLSGDMVKQPQHSETEQNRAGIPLSDPIYENFDGIMDINELPPPPPELLMDLPPPESEDQNLGTAKKLRPPPPPPKRSKETHLSSHEL